MPGLQFSRRPSSAASMVSRRSPALSCSIAARSLLLKSAGIPSAMASFLRLPAGSLLTASRLGFNPASASKTAATKPYPCRHFSQTTATPRAMRGMPQTLAPKQPAQPSMKTRGLEMSKSEMPQDMGLLPGTFVRPLWRDMPSIFQQPRERLQLEWLWIKLGFQNILGYVEGSFVLLSRSFEWSFAANTLECLECSPTPNGSINYHYV